MPTTPFAQVTVSLNAGAAQSGGVTAQATNTVQFSATSKAGWIKSKWSIVGPPGWTTPPGWTSEAGAAVYYGTTEDPPLWTLPASSTWGKWMVSLVVNDGLKYAGKSSPTDSELTDLTTALQVLGPGGAQDLGVGETSQFGASLRTWVQSIQDNLRKTAVLLASRAVTASSAVSATDAAIFVTTASAVTLTLPASPENGRTVRVKAMVGSPAITVDGNGKNIDAAGTFAMTTSYVGKTFIFDATADAWGSF